MIALKTALYPHQKRAVDKLFGLKVGALYMEMGTGKTRTALEFIKRRHDAGKIDRVLWLCPCSTRINLREDIAKHAVGALSIIAIHGIESLSASWRLYSKLCAYVAGGRTMLIVDESSLVKNHRAIRSRRITAIAQACPYRMILNGTPIGKNEADLFAQWYLLDWRILGYQSYWSFAANHLEMDDKYTGRVRRVLNVGYLTDKIAPYAYLVKKEDCLALPPKRGHTRYFILTDDQETEYEQTKLAFLSSLMSNTQLGDAAIYRTFTALQEVTSGRKILTDPSEPMRHAPMFADPLDNPRIQCLLDVLHDIDGQAIIWCKFTHEIMDIRDCLVGRYGTDNVALFYGGLRPRARQAEIERFAAGARFLIANKECAGFGLNLQFCHNSVYYNNDWNYLTRAQSEDRLHRIGQEYDINIVDIYAYSSIDMRILDCLSRKESLADWFRREVKNKNAYKWVDGDLEDAG